MRRGFTIAGDCQLVLHEGYVAGGIGDAWLEVFTPGAGDEAKHVASLAVFEDSGDASLFFRHSLDGAAWEVLPAEAGGSQANSMRLCELTNPRRRDYVSVRRDRGTVVAVLGVFSLRHGFRKSVKYRAQAANTWAGGAGAVSVTTSPGTD